jgi:hypothetical protein
VHRRKSICPFSSVGHDSTGLCSLTLESGGAAWARQERRQNTEIKEEWLMNLNEWEPTIQMIIEESNHEKNESGKHRILIEWRARLEKEPTLLQPFQIDEIVREVRRRLDNASR